jgi:TonB family protein
VIAKSRSEVWFLLMSRVFQIRSSSRRRSVVLSPSTMSLLCLVGCFLLSQHAAAGDNSPSHVFVERSGELRVSNGMTLHLNADLGNVRIQTLPPDAPPAVRYTVHIETDLPAPAGQKLLELYSLTTRETTDTVYLTGVLPNVSALGGSRRSNTRNAQFYVQFVVMVPETFNLDLFTGGGDIETQDIGGRVSLVTQGGNITAGRVGMAGLTNVRGERSVAKIETQGGHITLNDIAGDVDAYTAGGHILAGNIAGNAKLHTGGGHIRVARIKGTANLDTDGGNIAIGEAGSYVAVRTSGGQIDLGEVHGSVRAETGGGGIRVISVAGPMEVASSGGSICLTRVANQVHAETGEGTITAWISPEETKRTHLVRLPGPSQLASHTGDILVFLPRNIAMTIDATVETGGPGRIEADPALPLNIQSQPNGPVHVVAALNGGGTVLRLHTLGGKIQLRYVDTHVALRQSLQEEEKQRLAERFNEYQPTPAALSSPPIAPGGAPPELSQNDVTNDWFDSAKKRFQVIFMGSVHEDPKDFVRLLTASPPPEYPALAQSAGVQGRVVLQVRAMTDGTVKVDRVLEGQPALVDAATAAIQKWRAKPEQINGKSVETVSTVSFEFQLH